MKILGVALFFVWLVYNGGFKKIDVTKYEKPDDMGYDEFCVFIDKLKERQRKAKYFMILFMPFLVVMFVDLLIIRWTPDSAGEQNIEETIKYLISKININI